MTEPALYDEARRRFLRANPTVTADTFDTWLALALGLGASIVMQLDGCRAEYPHESAPASKVCAGKDLP